MGDCAIIIQHCSRSPFSGAAGLFTIPHSCAATLVTQEKWPFKTCACSLEAHLYTKCHFWGGDQAASHGRLAAHSRFDCTYNSAYMYS